VAIPPVWLALFAPLPEDAVIGRKPVASAELLAAGNADPIADWDSISVHLSDPGSGLRHVLVTLDGNDALISASDAVLFQREEQRGSVVVTIYDQETVGGRFEEDGSFRGTRWITHTEQIGDDDEHAQTTSSPSPPSDQDVASLRALVQSVIGRAPGRRPRELR
jgi:hypothetical protein